MKSSRIVDILLETEDPEEIAAEAGLPDWIVVEYLGRRYPAKFMSIAEWVEILQLPDRQVWGAAVEVGPDRWVKADILNMGSEGYMVRFSRADGWQERRIVKPDFRILALFARERIYEPPRIHLKVAETA